MEYISNGMVMHEINNPELFKSISSIQEIKKEYALLNKNFVATISKIANILLIGSFVESDIKMIRNLNCLFVEYKLNDIDIQNHGNSFLSNIIEVCFEQAIEHSILLLNSPDTNDWPHNFEKIKNNILRIDGDTSEILLKIKQIYNSMYLIFQYLRPSYKNSLKLKFNNTEKQIDIASEFNFHIIYNQFENEPNLYTRRIGFYNAISEKDLFCLKNDYDPIKFAPNLLFRNKCYTAIKILDDQIMNTIISEKYSTKENIITLEDRNEYPNITVNKNKEFTTKRQVLALYYILNELDKNTNLIDRTVKARFIQFLTGKNEDNIYKILAEPHKGLENEKNKKSAQRDMEYILEFFESIGLKTIVQKILNDLKDT